MTFGFARREERSIKTDRLLLVWESSDTLLLLRSMRLQND